jgi:hypothetical protein
LEENGEASYSLLPFMGARAYDLLEDEERKEFHLIACKFYKKSCKKLYDLVLKENVPTYDSLFSENHFEANIWAAIYRSVG